MIEISIVSFVSTTYKRIAFKHYNIVHNKNITDKLYKETTTKLAIDAQCSFFFFESKCGIN